MLLCRNFFINLGFDFKKDLKSVKLVFEKNPELTAKLEDSTFYYHSPNKTNTSFYFIATPLIETELKIVRRYLWNKNDADLLFYILPNKEDIVMAYAKYSPLVSLEDSTLDVFNTSINDLEKIEKVKHWQFDSGAFWLNYHTFIDKTKYKGIDKELASTLKVLRDQLNKVLLPLIQEDKKRNEVVQALIDRTLYIKYLEDNHIINSFFYKFYFKNESLNYKQLLADGNTQQINKLFKEIHKIFNNNLFERPTIENDYLNRDVCNLIVHSFNSELETGQLRLFDFDFDILPVEFISYIYEVFLSEKQKDNGIYYTPKKLAQLIVDDVIINDELGSVLDPSCGSGMFLIVAFQRLVEIAQNKGIEPKNNLEKIKFRTEILSKYIFGIEKELTAQRFTLFSLSLQIFRDIESKAIKEYIAQNLKENNKIDLFSEFSFFENIECTNSLHTNGEKSPFRNKTFRYIVGNPPFFEIPDTEEYNVEISFLNNYNVGLKDSIKANAIVGKNQISQCFFLKIKEWSDADTRFGFVSNSSNYYNDLSSNFQKYFYSYFGIEKIYELSRVKDILFEKAKESVIAIIFNNNYLYKDKIEYYPVDLGLFSEKPFELLIIQEDKQIEINRDDLINQRLSLRDFLEGNEYDKILIEKLSSYDIISSYFLNDKRFSSFKGLDRITNQNLLKYYNLLKSESSKELAILHQKYAFDRYLNTEKTEYYNTPYIHKPENKLHPFIIKKVDGYVNIKDINEENFQRIRNYFIYKDEKILINKFGKRIQAAYTKGDLFFSNLIYVIKLTQANLYPLFTAIINSDLINYYVIQKYKSRVGDNFANVNTKTIKNIPIPKELDEDISNYISEISKKITEGEYSYESKKEELNELIFDLYELSYFEKQRVRDYFLSKSKQKIDGNFKGILNDYKSILLNIISPHLVNPLSIDLPPAEFDLIVAKISLNGNSNTSTSDKVRKYILNEIFEQNPNENILTGQEKIFGKDCMYIIKKNMVQYWTKTKAFEDGQDILRHLISYQDEERIHQN